jgi:hypothetical protein
MHGIQTSGNCIRNITSDERAGIAVDEIADPRPYCEILRQWSTLHPEFAFLPRKFKIAVTGATEDRAATYWHDVGLHLLKDDTGPTRLQGAGRRRHGPHAGDRHRDPRVPALAPDPQLPRGGRAGLQPLGPARQPVQGAHQDPGQGRGRALHDRKWRKSTARSSPVDGAPHTLTQAEYARVAASFVPPALRRCQPVVGAAQPDLSAAEQRAYQRWLQQNVAPHQNPELRAVTLSFKRLGYAPGDATADQLEVAANLAERFSAGEARVSHDQNLVLPWVHASAKLPQLWQAARDAGWAGSNIRLLTDMIACPGGDFCALANARSLPIADAITRALPGHGRIARPGRDRPAHQRLHQLLRAPPQRPHRHPGCRQGRTGVVPDHAGRVGRLRAEWRGHTGQGGWPFVRRGRSARRDRSPARHLPGVPHRAPAVRSETFIDTRAPRGPGARSAAPPMAHAVSTGRAHSSLARPWKPSDHDTHRSTLLTPGRPRHCPTTGNPYGAGPGQRRRPAHARAGRRAPASTCTFPKFSDGRAFSQAFLLRRRLGFTGEIRATGDVLVDQVLQMQRSGFDSAVLRADQDAGVARRQLQRFDGFYQGDAVVVAPRFASASA